VRRQGVAVTWKSIGAGVTLTLLAIAVLAFVHR
jgi:hypothetical protein